MQMNNFERGLRQAAACLLAVLWVQAAGAQINVRMPVYGDYSAHDPSTMIKDGRQLFHLC